MLKSLQKRHARQNNFFSQASQDQFVYSLLYELLDKQDAGYYLEIGAGEPLVDSNTYFFEKNLKWKGVSIDLDESRRDPWSAARSNPLLIEDATLTDYSSILSSYPEFIDYLSLDIDANYDAVLNRIPFNNCKFKVITIEHDFHRFGEKYRSDQRRVLSLLGYCLVCADVSVIFENKACVFEDWWVHPAAFPAELLSSLYVLDLNAKKHERIIGIMRKRLRRFRVKS